METILSLIGQNQGISLMMDHAVSHIHQENIRMIPLEEEILSTVGLVFVKNRTLSESAKCFLDYVKEKVSFREKSL
jgi:DNA-binding transcriptional LysR family regulator